MTKVPLIISPDFSSVEFSASESFTTAWSLATVRFDSAGAEDVVLADIILLVAITSATEAVDTSAADVTLVLVMLSADDVVDVEMLSVEGAVVTGVVVLLVRFGFVRRRAVSVRLTGDDTVP